MTRSVTKFRITDRAKRQPKAALRGRLPAAGHWGARRRSGSSARRDGRADALAALQPGAPQTDRGRSAWAGDSIREEAWGWGADSARSSRESSRSKGAADRAGSSPPIISPPDRFEKRRGREADSPRSTPSPQRQDKRRAEAKRGRAEAQGLQPLGLNPLLFSCFLSAVSACSAVHLLPLSRCGEVGAAVARAGRRAEPSGFPARSRAGWGGSSRPVLRSGRGSDRERLRLRPSAGPQELPDCAVCGSSAGCSPGGRAREG